MYFRFQLFQSALVTSPDDLQITIREPPQFTEQRFISENKGIRVDGLSEVLGRRTVVKRSYDYEIT
jgi:hypothetical protein